ncbi:hypothetical protein ASG43_12350 [Aureimonas sp. Leaf454]|nr:hypothetical protein ASG43_12350 [Aureimonas sp. Leaf454]
MAVAGIFSADAMDTGGTAPVAVLPNGAKLMWGGPVPQAPQPGKASVYVPSPSAYAPAEPSYQPPMEPDLDPSALGDGLSDGVEGVEPLPVSVAPAAMGADAEIEIAPEAEPEPEDGDGHVKLYTPKVLGKAETGEDAAGALPPVEEASLAPLGAARDVPDDARPAKDGLLEQPGEDPWAGLTDVTPGASAPPRRAAPERLERRARPSFAELQRMAPPRRMTSPTDLPGRGALEDDTPSGYEPMPVAETMCRRELAKLGVRFTDASSIRRSRSCGIDHPVKITEIASGVAMRPAATLNCAAALRVAEWMRDEVQPAARWKLLKRPTAVINASSYRCSRIAGSRSISEHASGNALDVAGFKFADGSVMPVEKKGFFDFREKAFQGAVRKSACEYFGTVLGPGYNRAHADHLHLDAKQRRNTVCK